MRQEAEERKILEQQQKKLEKEESKYKNEIESVKIAISTSNQDEVEKLKKRLQELTDQLNKIDERKEKIISLQNGQAGWVYVISNIGSFGDNVFKIGMTRRDEPQERVDELGNASVPFPFDVHSLIFSANAVELENRIHQILDRKRVNKINKRKEFFEVDIDELERIVHQIDPSADFKMTALAEQYNQSLSLK
ncbi:GIY-YIG nuclease family protein [Methanobrevibacter sp.]|uniref:GIY-YIG nuclease family protein n=1 Tax=Methanobrevibacter sp. TaxID=66852 RepID=UPI003864AFA2